MADSTDPSETIAEQATASRGGATRRTTLAGFISMGVPVTPERLNNALEAKEGIRFQAGDGAAARTTPDKWRETVSLKDFGAAGDGVADETAALFRARDHCSRTGARLIIPAGDYRYSRSPNWAINNLEVIAEGHVRFFYGGDGNAVIIDGGQDPGDLCYNVRFCVGNRLHLYGKATTKNGVWARSVHHSHVGVNVHGCGKAYAGLYTQFSVCTVWDVVVSANEGGWFEGNKPNVGYKLDKRHAPETTSYCYFPNPVVEGVSVGIHLVSTLGNLFLGGTSEGCSEYGLLAGREAMWDRFIGTDFEVNTIADIYCDGLGVEFVSCDTYDRLVFGKAARRCVIAGGGHEHILLYAGSTGCTVVNTIFNRRDTGGLLVDNGVGTEISNVRSGVTPYARYLTGSLNLPPAKVGPGEALIETITVEGAKLGDFFIASCDAGIQGLHLSCHCNEPGKVDVIFTNVSAAVTDRAACVLRVRGTR